MSIHGQAGAKYLEFEIERCERRLKRIRENPDATKPKSNIMLYELERDLRLEQLEAVKKGKPLGEIGFTLLTRALGLVPWDAAMVADRTYGENAREYFDALRGEGMAEYLCDRTIVFIPMILRGDFPKPSFIGLPNTECIPLYLSTALIARLLDIPVFFVDRHFANFSKCQDEEQLQYVVGQLEELIKYAESKVPGCKYSEDKLAELQYYNRMALKHQQKLWQLRKRTPCPIPGREAFRLFRLPDMYPNPAKAVEYIRLYVEELYERADKGIGAVEQERLRLLWSVSAPFYTDPFGWLEKRGVAVPAVEMSIFNGWFSGREAIWGDEWHGTKLSPLEEEARQIDTMWGRLGKPWVQSHIDTSRELNLDGIVYFLQWGCATTLSLGRMVAETAERELGIPTLFLQGRMLDKGAYDESEFYTKLQEFVDICLDRKQNRERANKS